MLRKYLFKLISRLWQISRIHKFSVVTILAVGSDFLYVGFDVGPCSDFIVKGYSLVLVELFERVEDLFELLNLTDFCQLDVLAVVGELEAHGWVKLFLLRFK